jgi:hypothetical protein
MSRRKIITSVIVILVVAAVGFLGFDWYNINKMRENPDKVPMYSWTDKNGEKHFTNTNPPLGAKNIVESEGVAYVRPPLAIILKNKAIVVFENGQDLWNNYFGD